MATIEQGWEVNVYDFRQFKHLYLNEELSDIKFVFIEADTENVDQRKVIAELPSHKFLLSSSSEVFRKMFNGLWKDKTEIEIDDSSPEVFKEFLQSIYLATGTFTAKNIHDVLYLAIKYEINDCISACIRFLVDNSTPDTICSHYALVTLQEQAELKQYCEEKIIKNISLVLNSDSFLNCDQKMLSDILKLNFFCPANFVFYACLAWAKIACQKNGIDENDMVNCRNELGECFYLIQYTTMTVEEFTNITLKFPGFIEPEDFQDIIYCIVKDGYQSKKFKQLSKKEKLKLRPTIFWNEKKLWNCQFLKNSPIGTFQPTDSIIFSINKTTLLNGIHFCNIFRRNPSNDPKTIVATFNFIELKNGITYINHLYGNVNFVKNRQGHIKFPAPVCIEENVWYEIRMDNINEIDLVADARYFEDKISPNGLKISFKDTKNRICHLVACLEFMDI